MTKEQLSLRLPEALVAQLRSASDTDRNPYAPSMTQIIERGIELALRELERKKHQRRPCAVLTASKRKK